MVTEESNVYLRLHSHYKAGFLFGPGPDLRDQPNIYLEAMELLTHEFGVIREEKIKKAQADAEKRARGGGGDGANH